MESVAKSTRSPIYLIWLFEKNICTEKYIIIISIIIKKGRQWKAEREWYTPYQSKDPSLKIPTYRQKEEKGKKSKRL